MMSSSQRQDVTAIIYDKKGMVLSIGKNSYIKTHPLQAHYAKQVGDKEKIYLHAEIHAITRCRNIERAHKLVVFRYSRDGKPVLAKPCHICESAIAHTNIKVVEHT